jgi:hypothetical protein
MTEGVLAEVSDYESFVEVMREVSTRRQLTREGLDRVAGLASGYAGKLLAQPPMKALGPASMGPTCGALGIKLFVVEDKEAIERFRALVEANKGIRPTSSATRLVSPEVAKLVEARVQAILQRARRKGGKARQASMTPAERSEAARHAARERWAQMSPERRRRAMRFVRGVKKAKAGAAHVV